MQRAVGALNIASCGRVGATAAVRACARDSDMIADIDVAIVLQDVVQEGIRARVGVGDAACARHRSDGQRIGIVCRRWGVVLAIDRDRDGMGGAVGRRDKNGFGEMGAGGECLDRAQRVVENIRPVAGRIDRQAAIAAGYPRRCDELGLASIGIADPDCSGHRQGRVFLRRGGIRAGELRRVAHAIDRDLQCGVSRAALAVGNHVVDGLDGLLAGLQPLV